MRGLSSDCADGRELAFVLLVTGTIVETLTLEETTPQVTTCVVSVPNVMNVHDGISITRVTSTINRHRPESGLLWDRFRDMAIFTIPQSYLISRLCLEVGITATLVTCGLGGLANRVLISQR